MENFLLVLSWIDRDSFILFVIGILAAIVGVMFGAAGFVLLPAMLLFGVPIHATVAANKFATGISSLTTVIMLVLKRKFSLKVMFPLIIFACIGGITGAFLATRISEQIMNIMACIVLVFMFFIVLKGNKHLVQDNMDIEEKTAFSISPFLISIYDGGFGPGSALMNITYFLKRNYSYMRAVEMTRFII